MNKNLKPIGTLFLDTWKLYKKHLNLLALVSVIPFIFAGVKMAIYRSEYVTSPLSAVCIVLVAAIFSVLYLVFVFALPLAVSEAINEVHNGKIPDVANVYTKVFKHLVQYLLVALFVAIVTIGGYMLFVIPGIIAGIYIAFAMYTYYFEHKKGMDALILSAWYVKGFWWDILTRKIFLAIIILVALLAFVSVVGGIVLGLGFGFGVFTFLFDLFLFMVVLPFAMTFSYLLYKDVKSIKENSGHAEPTKAFIDEAENIFVGLLVIAAIALIVFFFLNAVPVPHLTVR
jgi:hypothetical protein